MNEPPCVPRSLHWLGERNVAAQSRHAMDMCGCVLYFERQSDCLQFMRWLEGQAGVIDGETMPATKEG